MLSHCSWQGPLPLLNTVRAIYHHLALIYEISEETSTAVSRRRHLHRSTSQFASVSFQMTDGEAGATRAAADTCAHRQLLWDPCSQRRTPTASSHVHMSTVKHSHLWTRRLQSRLGWVICHFTHFSSFWAPTRGCVMSEVTNSATTFSLPAGRAEGKFKLLHLQHLREEEKKTKKHHLGGRDKKKRFSRQSRRANNAL